MLRILPESKQGDIIVCGGGGVGGVVGGELEAQCRR